MAVIKKPRKNRKGTPPKVEEASNNLTNISQKKKTEFYKLCIGI